MLRLSAAILALASSIWAIGPGNQGGGGSTSTPFDPTGVAYSTNVVQKAGDTMTGALGIVGASLTASSGTFLATGATQFSIKPSSGIDVQNNAGVYAGFFVGNGAGLTGITGESNTLTASSKTVTGGSLTLGNPVGGAVISSNVGNAILVQNLRVNGSSLSIGGVVISSEQAGLKVTSMTLTATGNNVFSLTSSSGIGTSAGVWANFFVGSGAGLTNLPAATAVAHSSMVFTANGTWTKPTGVIVVDVEYCAGAGGTGSAAAGPPGGGGAGGYRHELLDVSTMVSLGVTIGAGGSSTNDGSDTSVGPLNVDGGGAGGDGSGGTGEQANGGGSGGGSGGTNATGAAGAGGGAGGPGGQGGGDAVACSNIGGSTVAVHGINQGHAGGCGITTGGGGGRGGASVGGLAWGGGGNGSGFSGKSGNGQLEGAPPANTCAGAGTAGGANTGASGKVIITVVR